MKILFVNEYIYPNVVSGAEFSNQALAEELKKQGNEIIFFGPNLSSKKIKNYKKIKIFSYYFPKKIPPYKSLSPFWFNNPLFWLYSLFFLLRCCREQKIEIIHNHGKYLLPSVIMAKLILKIPVVVTVRDYKFLCPLALCLIKKEKVCSWWYFLTSEISFYLSKYVKNQNFLVKLFLILRILGGRFFQQILFEFLKSADKVIAVSKALAEIYQKAGINKEKIIKIYNLPPKANESSKKVKYTVLSVGKLSYGKGTDILVKAMTKVKSKLPEAKLILLGQKSPSMLEIPSFAFHYKNITHEKIDKFYQQASVFVLLSRWPEPLSRATLEALSFGLPLILSNKGGNKEIVKDRINGYLVDLNPKSIAEKILLLLKNKKLREKMGKESLRILKEKFDPQKIIDCHLNLYQSLIK